MPETNQDRSDGNGENKWRWMILSAGVLGLTTILTGSLNYYYSGDVQEQINILRANADIERKQLRLDLDRAREQLEASIRRELDRIDRAHDTISHELDGKVDETLRREMLGNLQIRLDQLDTRLDRLESLIYRSGKP